MNGKNVLLIAPVGTGKTESAILPILSKILEESPQPISTLYITPLRALNRDLLNRLLWWCRKLDIEISVRHGDTPVHERKLQKEFPPQLLITTPETLQAILPGKRMREHLRNVRWVVVDEVHELVDSKRGTQLSLGLERLREIAGNFQIIGLSATIGDEEDVAKFLEPKGDIRIIKAMSPKAFLLKVIFPKPSSHDFTLSKKLDVSPETARRLREIVKNVRQHSSTLIFTNTREFAEILSSRIKMVEKELPIGVHHSSLSKEVRIETEKKLKEGELKGVIATSSLQLGIDVGSVDLVIQYQSPRQVTQLLQRVGRSGHGIKRVSKGLIIAVDEDDLMEAMVIARKALNNELEKPKMHLSALDVLAHQIVGLTLEYGKIDVKKAYQIVRRAFPYQRLSFSSFLSTCRFLQSLGYVFVNEEIRKRRRGYTYYFEQLSTIPSIKQYKVFNILDKRLVGVLDEEFVGTYGEEGTTFILKGEAYRITSVEEDKVFVEPVYDLTAAIPAWEGELIPVPFEVAQEVGRLRRVLAGKKDAKSFLLENYPIDERSAEKIVDLIEKQKGFGAIPDDKTILIEDFENLIIIHACFGSLVNETLGRFIASYLSGRIGNVTLKTDPYRILIKTGLKDVKMIEEVLKRPDMLEDYLRIFLPSTSLFQWKLLQVAKRFGAVRKDAKISKIGLRKMVKAYSGTPIFEETFREIFTEKLDVEKAKEMLEKIKKGDIKIVYKKGLSPLGRFALKHELIEVIGLEKPTHTILEVFKKRVLNSKVRLFCLNCKDWSRTLFVREVTDDLRCGKCGAKLLAILNPRQSTKLFKKRRLKEEDRKKLKMLEETAELFLVYGKKAVIAIACRGVGPKTAKRVLNKFYKGENEFYKALLEEERRFLQTKKYWKV